MRIRTLLIVYMVLVVSSTIAASRAHAACEDGGDRTNIERKQELGRVLLGGDPSISCNYLDTPYPWFGLAAHAGIDFPASEGDVVRAPVAGTYNLSSTVSSGQAVYTILPNGKRLFIHHLKNPSTGWKSKGAEIGRIYWDHVHAELRVNYAGTSLLGGASCPGETCSVSEIGERTDDPSEVVVSQQTLSVFDFWQRDSDKTYEASCNEGDIILDAQFKVRNNTGSQIYVNKLALAVHDSSGKYMFDAGELWDSEQYLPAGGVLHFYPREIWMTITGSYSLVAKAYYNNRWNDLRSDPFTVVSNDGCGGEVTTREMSDVVFDHIEGRYGHWFPSTTTTWKLSGRDAYFRYYSSNGSYLYTWIDGHLWYKINGGDWIKSVTIREWYDSIR